MFLHLAILLLLVQLSKQQQDKTTPKPCTCDVYNSCLKKHSRIDDCKQYLDCCDDDELGPLGDVTTKAPACTCVAYYLCPNDTLNTNGVGIIDVRLSECGLTFLEKCCDPNNVLPTPPPPRPLATGCGYRNANGVGVKLKNSIDREAEFGEFPWMVAVFTRINSRGPLYKCGGALIHPAVVVTAAHCVKNVANLEIRAGEWDTQTKGEEYPFQDRHVEEVQIHPKYKEGFLFNDIALLVLKVPVDMAPHINTICLPPQNKVFNTKRCFSSGWGKRNFAAEDKYQAILKKIELPIVPRDLCEKDLRKTRIGNRFKLHESFICAGGEAGKDTCTGDGGSPLVCPIEDGEERYFQAGIVAWGVGCGKAKVPGVYTNVPLFRDWIDEELQKRGFDIHLYQN